MADAPEILKDEKLRDSYPKLNAAIRNSNEALSTANTAKSTADTAKSTADTALANSESTQNQLDAVVIDGDSSPQIAQALADTPYTTLRQKHDAVDAQLADLTNLTNGQINLAQYPRLANETDDSPRIDRLLADLSDGSEFVFSGGELLISKPFIISKKFVRITVRERTTIKAISPMESCLKIESLNSTTVQAGLILEKITIDANNQADYGILISDTVGNYISTIRLGKITVKNAKLDGIAVYGPAWVVFMDGIQSEYNGRDGIRAIMNGDKQVNHIQITNSFSHSNTGNGITINGTSQSISNNTIERNAYGVSLDSSLNLVPGSAAWILKAIVKENYMELNRLGQIHLKVSSGNSINGLSITDNYLLGSNDLTHAGTSLIKAEGTGNIHALISKNYYNKNAGNVTKDIDGGNLFTNASTIDDSFDVINAGNATVKIPGWKVVPIPSSLIQEPGYTADQRSENILPLASKYLRYPLPEGMDNRMVSSQNVYVETDCTSFTVRCHYTVKNLKTGSTVKTGYQDITRTSSTLITSALTNLIGQERRSRYEFMYFAFQLLSSTGGTYLYFHVPYLELSN